MSQISITSLFLDRREFYEPCRKYNKKLHNWIWKENEEEIDLGSSNLPSSKKEMK
jgi:hypothetical protein